MSTTISKPFYVHVGFNFEKNVMYDTIQNFVPDDIKPFLNKEIISVCEHYYKQNKQIILESFYKKYENKEIIAYLHTLYVKKTKKNIYVAAIVIINGHWHYICINNDNDYVQPMKLKAMANNGELGPAIKLNNIPITCKVYRYIQNEKLANYY